MNGLVHRIYSILPGLDTRIHGLVYPIQRLNGLVIDKSGHFQTICQTNKYYQTNIYQTNISPNHVYGYIGGIYHRYKGLSISPVYRRILGKSHYMRQGRDRAGYIRDTKPYLLVYTNHSIEDT